MFKVGFFSKGFSFLATIANGVDYAVTDARSEAIHVCSDFEVRKWSKNSRNSAISIRLDQVSCVTKFKLTPTQFLGLF